MAKKIGNLLIVLGGIFIVLALGLTVYNHRENRAAGEASQKLMPRLSDAIVETAKERQTQDDTQSAQPQTAETETEPYITIDGVRYLGYLEIPALSLQLPVNWDFSMDGLKDSPCRYSGTLEERNLVIAAHNYQAHFGEIARLTPGNQVTLVDAGGTVHRYQVDSVETLGAFDTEQMTAGDWDLTLFTCTYGGKKRAVVRCIEA